MKNKKIIIGILGVVLCIIGVGIYFLTSKKDSVSKYVTLPKDTYHLKFENSANTKMTNDGLVAYVNDVLAALEDKADSRTVETLDDEYCQKNFEMSKDDFIEQCKKDYQDILDENSYYESSRYIFSYLMNNAKVKDIPEDIVEKKSQEQILAIQDMATNEDISYTEYLRNELGVSSIERYEKIVRENMKVLVQQEYVLRAIAEHYNLDVSEQEYYRSVSREDRMDELEIFAGNGGTEQTHINYYKNAVMPKLIEDADITYTNE